jgi:basic membrane protein A
MSHAVYDAAEEFPQQRFAIVDAWPLDPSGHRVTLPNVESILFREQESGFLAGVIAGLIERSRVARASHNSIGYLGGTLIPAVEHYLAGYVAGARKVDPTVRVVGQYAGSFLNLELGRRIALKQVTERTDILFQAAGLTGAGYLAAAKQHHVYGIGADVDESYLGRYILTSAIKRVDIAVRDTVGLTLRRGFRGGVVRLGAATGATGFAATSSLVPARVVVEARRYQREIANGSVIPPLSIPAR